jgi:glucosamine--fructose-6-phosphate aminotransferase (isomerizing)
LLSKYAKIKIEALISSEVQFSPNYFDQQSILIALSQSGESADVLEAVNIAKKDGAKIISIVNIMTSSLVHTASISVGLNCGPEIGVAATKSFTSQLAILYKITDKLCGGCMELDFNKVSESIKTILSDHSKVKEIAKKLKDISDIYVLGRGIHYPIASEASLKLKELTYVHAEGLPGGELKHGPLALMDSNVYVIIINPNDSTYTDTLSSAHEIKARGAKIIGISDKPNDIYDYWVEIPSINEALYPLIEIIPIQLLAYYAALEKDTDPDYPRNLAKSVTVK